MRRKIDEVLSDLLNEVTHEGRARIAEKHYQGTVDPLKRVTEAISAIKRGRWVLVEGDKR